MLEICLLGELQVRRDGTVLPLPASKKSRALLAYLTATARPHLRERLCELLWDGPDDPRAALRWSLTKLRPLIGTHLVAGREHVELKTEGVRVDLAALCDPANATLETLEATAALYRGQFIDGLDLPSCFRFQQWCNGERERLRQTHVAILTALSRRSTAPEKALTYARQRVAIDPFSDDAHATLIRMLAATDHAHDAMQHYEQCRAMFERELGSRPAAAIEDARRSIGRGTAPSPPRKGPALIEAHGASMVGRQKELREATRITADSMSASNDQIIYVTGEPGIGKSRFLDEVCSLMRAQGGMVMRARAFAAEMIRPYGIWTDALRNVTDLPAIASSESDRARLFDAVVDVLHRACASGAVIALDDLQWIDEGSAALLHYVARHVEGKSILIACAARPGEIADNLPAARLLRDLRRDKRVFDIPLGPLSGGEARELAQAISPDAADRVAEQSGGNPLFVIELARTQRGTSLAETMSARLADLEGPARELVGWAAAVGRQFDAEIVGRATGMPAGEMLSALDKLERCAIIRAAGERSYDFTHDLLRDAAYQLISGPRRTLAHRQIARAFQSVHDPEAALAGDVFHHAVLGGDDEMAAGAAVDAGRRCLRFFA
ncbi:MAG: AAA family ATPase, partial [Acidobacteriota bacterium]